MHIAQIRSGLVGVVREARQDNHLAGIALVRSLNGSAADLAGKLETLMDRPELRARMSRRAKEIFEKKFTGQVYARNVESVYRTIWKGAS